MRPRLLLLAATLLPLATPAQQQSQQPIILLDPARGGNDAGPDIADRVPEKTATLQLANRLASLLRARGFTVVLTRDSDTDVPSEARAAKANTSKPLACFVLHAAPTGRGVHLYTTALHQPADPEPGKPTRPTLWDEAQAPFADRSRTLAGDTRAAFDRGSAPVSLGQTWTRPLDNMQCPAVAVEVCPLKDGTTPDDLTYQSHVADTLASVALAWKAKVAAMAPPPPPPKPQPAPANPTPATTPATTTPAAPKPAPAPPARTTP